MNEPPHRENQPRNRRRKLLHRLQFLGGVAMFPLAVWFYFQGDYLGVGFAVIVGLIVLTYTVVNLFVRQWP
jgi:hypothetical protein